MGVFAEFVAAVPIGDVGLAQFLIGVLGLLWSPLVGYRAWVSARPHLRAGRSTTPSTPTTPRLPRLATRASLADTMPTTYGDETSGGVILPCYIVWLSLACFIQMVQSVVNMSVQRLTLTTSYGTDTMINAGIWGLQRISLEGLAFFLMHHSAGWHAVRNSLWMAAAAALGTFGLFIPAFANSKVWGSFVIASWNLGVGTFYGVMWLAPSSWVYRRPALLPLAAFLVVLRSLQGSAYVLQGLHLDVGSLVTFFGRLVQHIFLMPMLYMSMVMDTQFWQGRHPVRQQWYAQLIAPLEGIRFTLGSAAGLVHRIDQLTSTASIRQLNFSQLSLDMSKLLGAGGQARVYHGTYRAKPVAIKMLLCVELTQDIIEDFCTEAQILNELTHPNVVSTLGVCVVPPTVAIVMELCARGSLYDALRSPEADSLSLRARLTMCRDCAAGVAFLHEHQFVHRDLKSHNFLVGADWVVKLADLGVSQQLDDPVSSHRSLVRTSIRSGRFSQSSLPRLSSSGPASARALPPTTSSTTMRGTPTWSAPEVMLGEPYTAAADVYSLGLVCWEIMSSRVPFEQLRVQQELFEAVCAIGNWSANVPPSQRDRLARLGGMRPPMPTNVSPALSVLLDSCWVAKPTSRPTSRSVHATFDSLMQQLDSTGDIPYRVAWTPDVSAAFDSIDRAEAMFRNRTGPRGSGSEFVQINPLSVTA